ncbi:GNAT family N-acetyltransferase [Paenibacillus selenitireducens]|uniref:GNAT family N-acetyltransferase n=1 Tax=Paenibacillus selenitireducens TaxID=1324314 RepID=A0A1T2XML8_9BACL|nr:GNAT family N-acetyltransferase [Paenibacillus selenitireducens]OPA81062.1 GNAT family N-acetyltransferase [Paenibacillus selenitireducens]
MNIQIELVQREDYSDMITLADLTLPDRMNKHELKKYFELFPNLIFKATHEGRLVGFSCAGIDMTQRSGWMLFSNVAPDFQGQGIGKRLIEARLSALRSFPHLQNIWVTVNDTNSASIKALQAFGFQWSHDETDYYGPGKHRSIYRLPVLNLQEEADITRIKPQSMTESM